MAVSRAKLVTLDQIEQRIVVYERTGAIDPTDAKQLRIQVHPDLWPCDQERARSLFARIGNIGNRKKITIGRYTLGPIIGSGDVADCYLDDLKDVVIKVSREADGLKSIKREYDLLQSIQTTGIYCNCIPVPLEQLAIKDTVKKGVAIYGYHKTYTLREIVTEHHNISPRHIVWMFRRLMTCLGYIHQQGLCHGAVTPENIVFSVEQHTGGLVGYTHAQKIGKRLVSGSANYIAWYPDNKTAKPYIDTSMAARSLLDLTNLPQPIERLLRSMLVSSCDAFEMNDEMGRVACEVYGKPTFLPLTMTER